MTGTEAAPPMAKPNPIATLAEQLVRTLRELRDRGAEAYPTTRGALAAFAPAAPAADLARAFKKKPFASTCILAHKSDPQSPIVLVEDAERLTASSNLLEFALGLVCTPLKPAHPPAAVARKLDKALRPTFSAALERRLAAGDWPETVGVVTLRKKPHLYLKRIPLPPPPPATHLAMKLLDALQAAKRRDEYPTTLTRLVQAADQAAPPDLVRKALADKAFKPHVVVALAHHIDSPLALAADALLLAASPLLLETVLAATRTVNNQGVPVPDLTKKLIKSLRLPFSDYLAQCMESGKLRPHVGCLRIKTKPYLFLLQDAAPSPDREARSPELKTELSAPNSLSPALKSQVDFTARFDEAFDQLDREKGSSNFVSLVALRRALPLDRAAFDAGLVELRRAARYTLSGAEGRHGISDEERAAGIPEHGTLLLYVSRRTGH
jgi:hypothetical protein